MDHMFELEELAYLAWCEEMQQELALWEEKIKEYNCIEDDELPL